MLISQVLDESCPKCGAVGAYGNVSIVQNILERGCNSCNQWTYYPLPDLRKKIIYLDQFFLSHAFREQAKPFVDATARIQDMASRHLIVCPHSSVHREETHLWRHEQKENLYQFIKKTARGHEFNEALTIKLVQMRRSFTAFCSGTEVAQPIEDIDAFQCDLHQWDNYVWVDMPPILGDLDAKRSGKTNAVATLVDLFPGWTEGTTTFEEDVKIEAFGYGNSLLNQYLVMIAKVADGDLMATINSPTATKFVETLLRNDSNTLTIHERLKRIGDFFRSPYFCHTPYVRISCGLFSVLRKMVRNGAYKNPDKARRTLAGIYYDSECISVFGPYSDAIFMDKTMMQWCMDREAMLLEPHGTEVFSVANWEAFHSYLDSIEAGYTQELRQAMNWVYPSGYK